MLLIWTKPQFEAERVEKRKRIADVGTSTTTNGSANGHAENGEAKQNGHTISNAHPLTALDGTVEPSKEDLKAGEISQIINAPDEDIAKSLKDGYEYYWQAYPADAPFSTRLDWSVDLVLSFRGTGKPKSTAGPEHERGRHVIPHRRQTHHTDHAQGGTGASLCSRALPNLRNPYAARPSTSTRSLSAHVRATVDTEPVASGFAPSSAPWFSRTSRWICSVSS